MRWGLVLVAVAVAAAGCGQPTTVTKQAEAVHSIAAEGKLLAVETEAGDSTSAFTKTHARALRSKAEDLRAAIADRRLRAVAESVIASLTRLADDGSAAAAVARALERSAARADEVAKAR